MARSDYRHAMVDGKRVDLTETEIDACVAAEDAWAASATTRAAKRAILDLEALETPRRLAESVLSDEGKAWLTANRDKIATERSKL